MRYLIWAAALTLAACSNTQDDNPATAAAQSLLARVTGQAPEAEPPAVNPATLTGTTPGDSLLVRIVNRDQVAALRRTAVNGARETWESPGKVSMTFENGILVGTRGLNEDLMGADIPGVRAALNAGGGTVTRRHSYLGSEDQITTATMTCTIAREGTEDVITRGGTIPAVKYTEDCTGPRLVFTNSYWFDGNRLVQTRQLVSVAVGYIQSNPL
jgi:hypothetical protein